MGVQGKNSLFFATGLDNSGLQKGANEATGIVQGLASQIGRINPFAGLAAGAALIFAGVAKQAYDFAKQYEIAMKEVQTISKATQKDFKGISEQIFRLSSTVVDDPVKLANAYYQIVSAGYDGAEALDILEASSRAAIAGVTDTITAADGITTVMNAWATGAGDVNAISDALFKTVELGKTTFSQLASNIAQVAPIASALGVSYNEVLAAVATLTASGTPTAQAMTQIRAALIGVTKGLGEGWQQAYTLQEAFEVMSKEAGGSVNELKTLTGTIEGAQGILALTGKNAEKAAETLGELGRAADSTDKAFGRMISANTNQFELLGNTLKNMTYELGQFVLAGSNDLVTSLNIALKDTNRISDGLKNQQVQYRLATIEILDNATANEERVRLLGELKKSYPDYLADLDLENLTLSQLKEELYGVNDAMQDNIALQIKQEEIDSKSEDYAYRQRQIGEVRLEIAEKLVELENEYGVKFDENLSLLEQAAQAEQQFNPQQKVYNPFTAPFGGGPLSGNLQGLIKEFEVLSGWAEKTNDEINDLEQQKVDIEAKVSVDGNATDNSVEKVIREKLALIQEATSKGSLLKYLEDENEEVVQAAEARVKAIAAAWQKVRELGAVDTSTPIERYAKALKEMGDKFKKFQTFKEQLGEEEANKFRDTLGTQAEDYKQYLDELLLNTEDFSKKQQIALAAQSAGVDLRSLDDVQKVDAISNPVIPLKINFEVEERSIDEVEKEIQDLMDKFDKSTSESQQIELAAKIKELQSYLDKKRSLLRDDYDQETEQIENVSELGYKQLRTRLKKQLKEYEFYIQDRKKYAKEIEALEGEIQTTKQNLLQEAEQLAETAAQAFNSVADLFELFGDNKTADVLNQLGDVTRAGINLAGAISSGDPFAIIGASAELLKSALTVEIVSDTAKFEESIDKLEKSIKKLDAAISNSLGREKIANRQESLEELADLEQQLKNAERAEKAARKEVKLLGITIAKKNEGSGTSIEKLEELEAQADQAKQRVIDLNNELDELFTGTTSAAISSSIIDGLAEGKRGIADFADTFEEMMRNAILQSVRTNYIEQITDIFYKQFADNMESDGGLSTQEISQLRNQLALIINRSGQELDALNEILEEAGIAAQATDSRQGITGEIKTIQENTANVLAGTLNSIRLDVRNGLEANLRQTAILLRISSNTFRLTEQMEINNLRLSNIEKSLS